jgi:glycosyltransferase involved in cell wall biosynthesis
MKVAIISSVLPPTWSGQAILISRLLRDRLPSEYCLISEEQWDTTENEVSPRLRGNYYKLSRKGLLRRGLRFEAVHSLNAEILGRRIARIARRENCSCIVAFTGSFFDLPAGLAASKIMGVPFHAYVCDYYSQQQSDPRARAIAERLEPKLLRNARSVIVLNEFLQDELNRRYGVEPFVIHNPCDIDSYTASAPYQPHENEQRIVYTGAVYHANYDAFRNLIQAIRLLNSDKIRLHLYTAQAPAELANAGIEGPVVFHDHLPASEVPAIQKQADLLFLPLAFTSPYPKIIKTSAPFKMGEYLAAGRPVLVHAPADSFLASYFREHGCGLVVDELDPAVLASAISQALNDEALKQRLATRARARVLADFDIHQARDKFWNLLRNGAPTTRA